AAGARRRHGRGAAADRRDLDDGREQHGRGRRHVRPAGVTCVGQHVPRLRRGGARLRRCDDGAADRGPLMRRVVVLAALAAAAALATAATAAAFVPTDPLAAKQWYLLDDHAFDAWTVPPPNLAPVKVAVVDSGVDCSLPDFQGRILAKRSF